MTNQCKKCKRKFKLLGDTNECFYCNQKEFYKKYPSNLGKGEKK